MKVEEKTWTGLCDRTDWRAGPWDSEPDKVQWTDPVTGLACLVNRGGAGAWCGYVGLPPGHPWRELHYDDIPADIHGGLTYGPSKCLGKICHEVEGEDDVRWIGFDCAHAGDGAPGEFGFYLGGHYRRVGWVQRQVTHLAEQVANAQEEEEEQR